MNLTIGLIIGYMGVWVLSDGWYSLALYIGRPGQGWLKDHSIRAIRIMVGITMMVLGVILVIWGGS